MWTTDSTIIVAMYTVNILLWLIPLTLNRSLSSSIDKFETSDLGQVQAKTQAKLRVKLQFCSLILCLVSVAVTQITVSSLA